MTTLGKTLPLVANDLTGQRFGDLIVVARAGRTPGGHARWLCRCDCGQTSTPLGKRLRSGETRSCGCRMREGGGSPRKPIVGYAAAHRRLERDRGKASTHQCVDCLEPAAEWSYIGGDPHELRGGQQNCPYSLDPSYYVPRCHSCHRQHDYQPPTAV